MTVRMKVNLRLRPAPLTEQPDWVWEFFLERQEVDPHECGPAALHMAMANQTYDLDWDHMTVATL